MEQKIIVSKTEKEMFRDQYKEKVIIILFISGEYAYKIYQRMSNGKWKKKRTMIGYSTSDDAFDKAKTYIDNFPERFK